MPLGFTMLIDRNWFSVMLVTATVRRPRTKSSEVNRSCRNIHSTCAIFLEANFRTNFHQEGNRSFLWYTPSNYIKLRIMTSKRVINYVILFNFRVLHTIRGITLDWFFEYGCFLPDKRKLIKKGCDIHGSLHAFMNLLPQRV